VGPRAEEIIEKLILSIERNRSNSGKTISGKVSVGILVWHSQRLYVEPKNAIVNPRPLPKPETNATRAQPRQIFNFQAFAQPKAKCLLLFL
jgi:hypothetical protein